jgi:hypothetical protein
VALQFLNPARISRCVHRHSDARKP